MKTKLWHTSCRTSATKPLWLMIVVLIVICHISCSTTGKDNSPTAVAGKYCSHGSSWFRGKILEQQEHARLWPMLLIHLYLRADGCFVAGTCDNQIWQAGRYKASGSSVTFYDVYDFENKKNIPDHTASYDSKRHQVVFRFEHPGASPDKQYTEIATLELDWKKGKLDFLRNEDWPLDSLYKYNIHWDRNKQHAWMDSMITVKHIKVVNGVVQ